MSVSRLPVADACWWRSDVHWSCCAVAVFYADAAIKSAASNDLTAPSIWTLQRLPWNPGGYGMGSMWGYKMTLMPTDFYVWTFVHDYSGVKSVNLLWRQDDDGGSCLDVVVVSCGGCC